MRTSKLLVLTMLAALALAHVAASPTADGETGGAKLATTIDQASYGMGYQTGFRLRLQGHGQVDVDLIMQGLRDGLNLRPRKVTAQQAQQASIQLKRQIGEHNLKIGKEFLEANGKKPGVQRLPNGLQYKVIAQGNGPTPNPKDIITAHYRGTLIDGTVFESSYDSGRPMKQRLDKLIPAWGQALQVMQVGSKWKLFIPPVLAYGNDPRGPGGANSVLIFDIELLDTGATPAQPFNKSGAPNPSRPGGRSVR